MIRRLILTLLCVGAPLFLEGCFRYVSPIPTPLTYDPKAMDVLGTVEGEVTQWYLLGIPLSWKPFSSAEATRQALDSGLEHGHAILNPQIDNEIGAFLCVSWQTIRVSGTAIRYGAQGFNTDGTLKFRDKR